MDFICGAGLWVGVGLLVVMFVVQRASSTSAPEPLPPLRRNPVSIHERVHSWDVPPSWKNSYYVKDDLYTKLVGVSFDGRQELVANLTPGQRLMVIPSPNPKFPEGAAVALPTGECVGWLAAQWAPWARGYLDSGRDIDVYVTDCTGGQEGKESKGANVWVGVRRVKPHTRPPWNRKV